jgi:Asp-tRNA(Asn)/Glu-tRNA(Gln) amidotransferase A subunit family amidase
MAVNGVHDLDATGASAAIKAREITAGDYIDGLIGRIETIEPEVQAWQYFKPEEARAKARLLDEDPSLPRLPLAGAAVGVKDIIDTADMPTENGTALDAGRRPGADAAVVRLLREAGAVVMGKTVTTELAFLHPSRTRNPVNPQYSPGGSSSGSAAAVAAGMVPIALGTQTAGSVIRPASFCGVYGFKPTYGLFPRDGVIEEATTLDTIGVFARSLRDIAAVTGVLAGKLGEARADYCGAATGNAGRARFAFVKSPAWPFAEEGAKTAIETFTKALGDACGLAGLPPEFDLAIGFHRTIMFSEMASNYARYYSRGKDRLSPEMREALEAGRAMPAVDYYEGLRARERLYRQFLDVIEPYDAIVTLPATGPAPLFGTTGNPVFCSIWTYLGVPALSLPLLAVNGLPLGVQLNGRRFGEERLFHAARSLLEVAAPGTGTASH